MALPAAGSGWAPYGQLQTSKHEGKKRREIGSLQWESAEERQEQGVVGDPGALEGGGNPRGEAVGFLSHKEKMSSFGQAQLETEGCQAGVSEGLLVHGMPRQTSLENPIPVVSAVSTGMAGSGSSEGPAPGSQWGLVDTLWVVAPTPSCNPAPTSRALECATGLWDWDENCMG